MSAIPESRPDKNEKLRARMQRGAAQFLEPGETVACGVSNLAAPAWLHGVTNPVRTDCQRCLGWGTRGARGRRVGALDRGSRRADHRSFS